MKRRRECRCRRWEGIRIWRARGAEVTVARVIAVAQWLRDEVLIPAHACVPPKYWKQELRDDWMKLRREERQPEPSRPRHTGDEMRSILAAADSVDPRFALLMALGAELRLGQVCRAWRSDLMLEDGTFTVRSHGTKRGTVVKLTEGSWSAGGAVSLSEIVTVPWFEVPIVYTASGSIVRITVSFPSTSESSTGVTVTVSELWPIGIVTSPLRFR